MDFDNIKILESDIELSHFARAIAIPVRISMIRLIIAQGTWVSHDVFSVIGLGPVTIERHLKAMVHLGLIKEKHYNRKTSYNINEEVFLKMAGEFTELFDFFKRMHPKE
ncbi:hypothetical protein [uncultured Mucilaginibacter sp.]|uniref:hypothetical protein n=1 Tax=uncultured Mucilaginibacter sp. TaxID=797541 RepID=UPI0025DCAA29|nr:hypothetical protein [uncultured Mucilaginibacter sp.]